jgi:chitin disaccharide deacetylase
VPNYRADSSPLRVILTADDFGLASPVNEAVERAHCTGVLTSASLMVAETAAVDAVARARRLPSLRVGLHVVVADGRTALPPDQIRSIVDANGRLSDRLVAASVGYFCRSRARRELQAEVRAQFEAFRATGLSLDHVDTHRHMILHPTVLSIILALAVEFQVKAIRLPSEPWRATRGLPFRRRAAAALRIACLAPWLALLRFRVQRAGIRINTEVRGLSDTGHMDEATVLRLISTVDRDVTEMFFHPATATESPTPLPQPVRYHVAELEALCSPRVHGALDRLGLRRISYTDLLTAVHPDARAAVG